MQKTLEKRKITRFFKCAGEKNPTLSGQFFLVVIINIVKLNNKSISSCYQWLLIHDTIPHLATSFYGKATSEWLFNKHFFMTVSFNPILINTCIWLLASLKTVKIIGKNL